MIPYAEALSTVLSQQLKTAEETVALAEALGRFLAEPVASPLDAPPFDKAAMDGYAVSAADERSEYTLRNIIAAGDPPNQAPLELGQADKIMTGGPVPAGAGKIIRVEFTKETDKGFTVTQPEPYPNIIAQGENIRAGESLLEPCLLGPKEIGCLAAAGIAEIPVKKRLIIGVINTGNELKSAGDVLSPGEIYDSNGPQLVAQITAAGAVPNSYGIIADDRETHSAVVSKGLAECDILVLTGGVSKGDYDYVPEVLEDSGVRRLFHGVRVKPGRPSWFGRTDDCLVFGLPGNPVSVFIQFEALIRPLIQRLSGAPEGQKAFRGRLTKALKRRDVDRAEFLPASTALTDDGITVTPLRYGGSSHLNALALADSLIFVPGGVGRLEEGDYVDARLL